MILSRSADAAYWMCRYLERMENIARFIDVHDNLLIDRSVEEDYFWNALIESSGDQAAFQDAYPSSHRNEVIQFLTFDLRNPNSIASCIRSARQNAMLIRDALPTELWESINRCYWLVREYADLESREDLSYLSKVRSLHRQHLGVMDSCLSRDELWLFCHLGLMIERADKTSRILEVKAAVLNFDAEPDSVLNETHSYALLRSVEALHMYRKHFHTIKAQHVMNFLISDADFPRSLHFCLTQAERCLRQLSEYGAQAQSLQKLSALRQSLQRGMVPAWSQESFRQQLDRFQVELNAFGEALHQDFFAPTVHPQPSFWIEPALAFAMDS